jgi:uncharacterized protein (DUF2252 family)
MRPAAFAPEARGETVDRGSDMPETVRLAMRRAAGLSWKHLADERIEESEPLIPLGKRFWPLTSEEHATVEGLFAEEPVRKLATSLRSRAEEAEVRVLDAAYWRKGCSSLGRLRLAVLLAAGRGKEELHCLMDVKEAAAAAGPHQRNRRNASRQRRTGGRRRASFVAVSRRPHAPGADPGEGSLHPRIAAAGSEARD